MVETLDSGHKKNRNLLEKALALVFCRLRDEAGKTCSASLHPAQRGEAREWAGRGDTGVGGGRASQGRGPSCCRAAGATAAITLTLVASWELLLGTKH